MITCCCVKGALPQRSIKQLFTRLQLVRELQKRREQNRKSSAVCHALLMLGLRAANTERSHSIYKVIRREGSYFNEFILASHMRCILSLSYLICADII